MARYVTKNRQQALSDDFTYGLQRQGDSYSEYGFPFGAFNLSAQGTNYYT